MKKFVAISLTAILLLGAIGSVSANPDTIIGPTSIVTNQAQ